MQRAWTLAKLYGVCLYTQRMPFVSEDEQTIAESLCTSYKYSTVCLMSFLSRHFSGQKY